MLTLRHDGIYTDKHDREIICAALPGVMTFLHTRAALAREEVFTHGPRVTLVTAHGEPLIDLETLTDTGKTYTEDPDDYAPVESERDLTPDEMAQLRGTRGAPA